MKNADEETRVSHGGVKIELEAAHLERLKLRLVEASCASCITPLKRRLEGVRGVEWVGANPVLDLVLVDYDANITNRQEILALVRKAGFKAVPAPT